MTEEMIEEINLQSSVNPLMYSCSFFKKATVDVSVMVVYSDAQMKLHEPFAVSFGITTWQS